MKATSALEVVLFVLIKSCSILAVGLQCIRKDALFQLFQGLIDHLMDNFESGKKIIVLEKSLQRVLDPKICTNAVTPSSN